MKTDGVVGMGGEVVEELFAFLHSLLHAFGLLACNGAEGSEDGKVNGARIIEDAADVALDLCTFVIREGGGRVRIQGALGVAAVLLQLG